MTGYNSCRLSGCLSFLLLGAENVFQQDKPQGTTWCLNYPSVLLFGFLSIRLHKGSESPAIDHRCIISVPYITDQGMHFPAVKSINAKVIFRSRRNTGIQVELSDLYQGKTYICTTKTKVANNSLCVELKDLFSVNLLLVGGRWDRRREVRKEEWNGELYFVNILALFKTTKYSHLDFY